jgi:hypothetical protein
MSNRRVAMHRLKELVRLLRLGRGPREVARLLSMGPNTEKRYRHVLAAAGLLDGPPDDRKRSANPSGGAFSSDLSLGSRTRRRPAGPSGANARHTGRGAVPRPPPSPPRTASTTAACFGGRRRCGVTCPTASPSPSPRSSPSRRPPRELPPSGARARAPLRPRLTRVRGLRPAPPTCLALRPGGAVGLASYIGAFVVPGTDDLCEGFDRLAPVVARHPTSGLVELQPLLQLANRPALFPAALPLLNLMNSAACCARMQRPKEVASDS